MVVIALLLPVLLVLMLFGLDALENLFSPGTRNGPRTTRKNPCEVPLPRRVGQHSQVGAPRMFQRLAGGEVARDLERQLVRAERIGAGAPQHHPGGDHDSVLGQTQLFLDPHGGSLEEA